MCLVQSFCLSLAYCKIFRCYFKQERPGILSHPLVFPRSMFVLFGSAIVANLIFQNVKTKIEIEPSTKPNFDPLKLEYFGCFG